MLKLVGKDGDGTGEGTGEDSPMAHPLALDAIRTYLKDSPIGEIETEDVVGFTICIELTDGIVIAGDSEDYYQLVGSLEDAKFALLLNQMQSRIGE